MIAGGIHVSQGPRRQPWPGLHPVLSLGTLILGLVGGLILPVPGLLAVLLGQILVLHLSGLKLNHQIRAIRPWLPMLGIIVLIHIFTTTGAAPLGTPSWGGLKAGGGALLRLAGTFGWLALYLRQADQDDLVLAVVWWLAPLQRLGVAVEDFGLVLAVALGTAPVVMAEGRRIETSLRLRGSGTGSAQGQQDRSRWKIWRRRLLDRARLAVPLVESLVRRADALTLSLRSRRPGHGNVAVSPVPATGLVILFLWAVALVTTGLYQG